MNRIYLTTGVTVLLLVLSSAISAANFQVPVTRTIVRVSVYDGYAAVEYTPSLTNTLSCTGSIANRFAIIDWRVDPDKKTMYSAALGAYLIGKTVGMGLTDGAGCSTFGGGTPVIYRLDIAD
jgi:hypothetical protein